MKNVPEIKSLVQVDSLMSSIKPSKKTYCLYSINSFKILKKQILPNNFYEANITPIPTKVEIKVKKENTRHIFSININVNFLNKNFGRPNLTAYQKGNMSQLSGIYHRAARRGQITWGK